MERILGFLLELTGFGGFGEQVRGQEIHSPVRG